MSTRLQTQAKTSSLPAPSFTGKRLSLSQREPALLCGKRLVSQPPLVQPKLAVNPPDDRHEEEADRVAEQVMRMPQPRIQRAPT